MEAFSTGKKLYFKGTEYRLSLSFSNDYPFKPPEVKFETSCFHILMWMYVATFVWTFFSLSFVNCDWSGARLRWGFVKGSSVKKTFGSPKTAREQKR
ncbi:hypothetical protein G4B88_027768 [Cannabis sativa]|uniref:UBC core domain-containing protein n=1 Tax=Cannabis sativa TaxID=3483 RepID=A0A7J6DNR4_CANSA|nr:hypothetical protein G4B88_027768 [Cannabis sativa]